MLGSFGFVYFTRDYDDDERRTTLADDDDDDDDTYSRQRRPIPSLHSTTVKTLKWYAEWSEPRRVWRRPKNLCTTENVNMRDKVTEDRETETTTIASLTPMRATVLCNGSRYGRD